MTTTLPLIFFGDSLTFGYGVSKIDSWVYNITQNITYLSLNKSCNGDTSVSMLSRYYTDVLNHSPSTIFIMCGTNDLLLGRSLNSIISNIELMIQEAFNINSKVIIGIPPAIIGDMANNLFSPSSFYNYAEKEIINLKYSLISLCKKYSCSYINFYDITVNNPSIYLDGIHLNPLGHQIMFNEALKYFFRNC